MTSLDAIGQAALVRSGDISAAELLEVTIARIEQLNPDLNAVITTLFDEARRQLQRGLPDGPFAGVPLLVKDFMCAIADAPYYAGLGALRARGWRSERDSFVAARLRAAGFLIVGRTNTPELALMLTTEPLAFGPTRNPWSLRHSSGGSSGGSAAAVAAHMVAVAHGNDGAGSIRVPASACGLVGLKPSRGRVSLGPDVGESLGLLAVEGALTRTVRDTAAMLDVMAGASPGDPCVAPKLPSSYAAEVNGAQRPLRVGFLSAVPDLATHPECVAAVDVAARLLVECGHHVEPAGSGAELTAAPIQHHLSVRNGASVAAALKGWSSRTRQPLTEADVEPTTWALATQGWARSAVDLAEALHAIQTRGRQIATWFAAHFDVLLTPTMAEPPPLIGDFRSDDDPMWPVERARPHTVFTLPFNISGQPAVSLPLHYTAESLPIGVQLAASYGREDVLIRLASQLEVAGAWRHRRPPAVARPTPR